MGELFRVVLVAVMLVCGWVALGYALYLQYASLPEEHTMTRVHMRLTLALGGIALLSPAVGSLGDRRR